VTLVSLCVVIAACSHSSLGFKPSNPDTNPPQPSISESTPSTSLSTPNLSLKLKSYENDDLGISLKYPSDWTIKKLKEGVQFVNQKDANYVELRDQGTATKDLKESVYDHISSRNNSRTDFKIQNISETKIADVPSYEVIYTFSGSGDQQIEKVLRYYYIVNNKEYTIAYISNIDSYQTYLPTAKAIINSIGFK
jgi:ribosomal protein L20A (L18A)